MTEAEKIERLEAARERVHRATGALNAAKRELREVATRAEHGSDQVPFLAANQAAGNHRPPKRRHRETESVSLVEANRRQKPVNAAVSRFS